MISGTILSTKIVNTHPFIYLIVALPTVALYYEVIYKAYPPYEK